MNQIAPASFDDKQNRLANRSIIESLMVTMKREFGDKDKDLLNRNGLSEHFVDGAYIRQLFIPKDTTIVSELWKKDRFWIISEGEVEILTELGKERIIAPFYGLAPYGTRVALYTLKDTMWFAITGVDDPERIEEEIIVKDYKELEYPWDIKEGA